MYVFKCVHGGRWCSEVRHDLARIRRHLVQTPQHNIPKSTQAVLAHNNNHPICLPIGIAYITYHHRPPSATSTTYSLRRARRTCRHRQRVHAHVHEKAAKHQNVHIHLIRLREHTNTLSLPIGARSCAESGWSGAQRVHCTCAHGAERHAHSRFGEC